MISDSRSKTQFRYQDCPIGKEPGQGSGFDRTIGIGQSAHARQLDNVPITQRFQAAPGKWAHCAANTGSVGMSPRCSPE
jgi:hypothetical protein